MKPKIIYKEIPKLKTLIMFICFIASKFIKGGSG